MQDRHALRRALATAVLGAAITAVCCGTALAESWKPVAGEAGVFVDADFTKVDQASGLVVLRSATGGEAGKPYAGWGKSRSPIMLYALDCAADSFMFLGLDYTGAQALPKTWRATAKEEGIGAGVGAAGKQACAGKDALPKAALP